MKSYAARLKDLQKEMMTEYSELLAPVFAELGYAKPQTEIVNCDEVSFLFYVGDYEDLHQDYVKLTIDEKSSWSAYVLIAEKEEDGEYEIDRTPLSKIGTLITKIKKWRV